MQGLRSRMCMRIGGSVGGGNKNLSRVAGDQAPAGILLGTCRALNVNTYLLIDGIRGNKTELYRTYIFV